MPVTFDLIVATVERTSELGRLLDSLEAQAHPGFRVIVVDQNPDDRLTPILAAHPRLELLHLRSPLGLSRARNVGLRASTADVVAFPDDDCEYPDGLLDRVAAELERDPGLDGLTGVADDPETGSSDRWPSTRRVLDLDNVWHGGNSHTIFLRRRLLEAVGGFDEGMGFGSGNPWELAEEIDVLVRALVGGARIEQDPSLVVTHVHRSFTGDALTTYARRSGSGVGYILGKVEGVPIRLRLRMAVRPAGGLVVALARRDREGARFQRDILRWRICGYRAGRRAARSAG